MSKLPCHPGCSDTGKTQFLASADLSWIAREKAGAVLSQTLTPVIVSCLTVHMARCVVTPLTATQQYHTSQRPQSRFLPGCLNITSSNELTGEAATGVLELAMWTQSINHV